MADLPSGTILRPSGSSFEKTIPFDYSMKSFPFTGTDGKPFIRQVFDSPITPPPPPPPTPPTLNRKRFRKIYPGRYKK